MTDEIVGSYSEIADEQLDELEAEGDADLYNDILTLCHFIFSSPEQSQSMSTAITTKDGIRFRLAVPDTRRTKSSGPQMVLASRQCFPTRSSRVANASFDGGRYRARRFSEQS